MDKTNGPESGRAPKGLFQDFLDFLDKGFTVSVPFSGFLNKPFIIDFPIAMNKQVTELKENKAASEHRDL